MSANILTTPLDQERLNCAALQIAHKVAKASGLPVVLTLAPMAANEMMDGEGIVEICQRPEQGGADVVGLNCFRGSNTIMPWLRKIRTAVLCHVGELPILYRTTELEPTALNLSDNNGCSCPAPHGRTFPTTLDPLSCNCLRSGFSRKRPMVWEATTWASAAMLRPCWFVKWP